MNRRTQILGGAAALGVVVALVLLLTGGGPNVVKPLRMAAGTPLTTSAEPSGGNPRKGYDAFRFFHTRNVFDPDRRPPRTAASTPSPPTPPPARTDFVALTGVLVNEGRSLAFFSGSRADYNKVLSLRDKIAGAEITQILPAGIEIDRAGQKTQVAVGQTVPFGGGAAPGAAPAPDTYASAPSTGSAAATGSSWPAAGASPSPADQSSGKQDDIRRRMEERRRQEQK